MNFLTIQSNQKRRQVEGGRKITLVSNAEEQVESGPTTALRFDGMQPNCLRLAKLPRNDAGSAVHTFKSCKT